MKKDRRGETEGIDTIKSAIVPVDKPLKISHSLIALNGANRYIASKPHARDDDACKGALRPVVKRHKIAQRNRDKRRR